MRQATKTGLKSATVAALNRMWSKASVPCHGLDFLEATPTCCNFTWHTCSCPMSELAFYQNTPPPLSRHCRIQ